MERFETPGGGRLARMLSLMLLGDFASVYLAYLNGVDPTPVDKIDRLKKELA
jgi:glucose/mannose-6-phosphate isomerase